MDDLPESFPKALRSVIDWTGLTQEAVAEQAAITHRTLARLLSGETEKPSPQIVMKICIGLKLPVELSIKLMERSENSFHSTQQDVAYLQLLFFSGYYSIAQCNRILELQQVKPLGESLY